MKDSIYPDDFNYKSEEQANNCGVFIPKSKCPAVNTSKAAHPLITLSRCAQCRGKLVAFCVTKLAQDPTKQPSEIIRAGAQLVDEHPEYSPDIVALQETVAKIYRYKTKNTEVANEKGMQK